MPLRNPDSTVGPFRERDSVVLTGLIVDNAAVPVAIPVASLTSATFTLYTESGSNQIINSRNRVNILSSISSLGVLTLALTPEDMTIVDTQSTENHRALIEWVWDTTKRGSYEIRIIVQDVLLVP